MKKQEFPLYRSKNAMMVRTQYVELLHQGKSGSEAAELLQTMAGGKLEDTQYSWDFWLALADTMWNYGRLTEQVKNNAVAVIEMLRQTLADVQETCPQVYARRMLFLRNLEEKLCRPQPTQKKVAVYQIFQNPWEIGDVFSYRLSDSAGEFAGDYVYVHVVHKQVYWPGHTVPVVRVFNGCFSIDCPFEQLKQAGYLPQFWGPDSYNRQLDEQFPDTVRMHDVLYNMLLSASNIQEYQMFTFVGHLPIPALQLDRVQDANESTCRLFEVETVSSLRKWKGFDVYALLSGQ